MKTAGLWLALVLAVPIVFAANPPKPVRAAVGEEFKIALESDPSSGKQWLIARPLDDRFLKFIGSEYRRGRPGVGGRDVLSFKALTEGTTQIHLKYGQLWERDETPARTTNFVVVIAKTGDPAH